MKFEPVPPQPDDLAVIMYTSGSTDLPKGVMISHSNVVGALSGLLSGIGVTKDDVYLSFLPLAHVLAFIVECAALYFGATIGYGRPRTLVDSAVKGCLGDIRTLRPTIFCGVPTMYDKIKQTVAGRISKSPSIIKFLFSKGFSSKAAALKKGQSTPLWNLLVFNKLKDQLGGKVRVIVSGGAPLSPECHQFLQVCFSAPVLQGYGLTETCGAGTLMEVDDFSTGSAGPPVACCEIKLVDVPDMEYRSKDDPPRGEIWIRGKNVALGYYKKQKTENDFVDGWFRTGDVGQFLSNGNLQIIDRIKNLVKPPHGEYIAIERLESIYKNSKFIDNICIHADSNHYDVVALVAPNKSALQEWATKNNIKEANNFEELCNLQQARKAVMDDLVTVSKASKLKSIELVKNVKLFPEEWTPDNGWLTAATKLRRNYVEKQYKPDIDKLYTELGPPS